MASNRNASLGDMVRSVVLIGILILGLAGVGYWFQIKPDKVTPTVDYATAATAAQGVADFDILTPSALPVGWNATTVRYESGVRGAWHLGVITDKGAYIGLEQTALSPRRSIEKFAPDTTAKGQVRVGGFDWELRRSNRGETTLIRVDKGITIVVTGTAEQAVIETYTATLTNQ